MNPIQPLPCRLPWLPIGLLLTTLPTMGMADPTHTPPTEMEALLNMDFKELAAIHLTSATRQEQKLVDTTAAVTVIDAEEIRRSGLTSLPELLRRVPGLNVARINADNWAISARGFNAQFSNKLLVLMDGRTLYTPLFAGVNWNLQQVLLADVERIEVIRGPGATMWGANAVNGVINIITKKAADTRGTLLSVTGGTTETIQGAIRHGDQAGTSLDYRIQARGFEHDAFKQANGSRSGDDWHGQQGGFRADWHRSAQDEVTFDGDLHEITEQLSPGSKQGGHLLTRWTRTLPDQRNWSLQFYFDRNIDTTFEQTTIYDLDGQYAMRHGDHALLWGAGYRLTTMDLENTPVIQWLPPVRNDQTMNLFVQDEITLNPDWKLTLGTKVEHNDYTGVEWQPNARLLWRLSDTRAVWAAVARAVRTPSRVDADFQLAAPIGPTTILTVNGTPEIRSETLLAWELGYRAQLKPELSLDLTAFYNQYDQLVSMENRPPTFIPPTLTLHQHYDNQALASTHGLETALDWRVNDGWKLRAAYSWLHMNLELTAGSTDTTTLATAGDSPRHQWQLHSFLDLPHDLEFDAALYHVTRLPHPAIPAVTRLDLRLGWRATPALNLSLTAQNLLDDRHPEFTGTSITASEVPRALLARMDWNF
ncbi:MAG: TonB-dependent receptor [Magnetococcales bacterium]|nr:TonB-dependent receptor [Magnetococcales bacterium]